MSVRKALSHGTTIAISSGTIFRVLIIAAVVTFLYVIRDIVAMTLVALFLAALIDPFAEMVARWRIPRAIAVLVVYVFGLFFFSCVAFLVIPPFIEEISELFSLLSPFFVNATGLWQMDSWVAGSWSTNLVDIVSTVRNSGLPEALPKVAALGTTAIDIVFRIVVVLILAFYFVVEKNAMVKGIRVVTPPEYQPFVLRLALKTREQMGVWLRGELALMGSIFILIYGALSLIGIPYALVLALCAALLEVIPFVGPTISAIPAIILALTVSPLHALITAGAYLVIQQVEGNILVPKIMQKVAGVNPVVSVVAVLIGARVGGIVGAILSIPVAMVIAVFLHEIFYRESLE
ncbi:MAG: AI-2E family transporter [Patescibacteria group bacterium]|jgi:predicted PurR-regulated permease PerM